MRTRTFIYSILTICLLSTNIFSQESYSELSMMGVKFTVNDNQLVCENMENSAKILGIIEAEVAKTSYATITYKCVLKEKEIKHFDLYLNNGKLDVSITGYYGNDGNGNLKGITLDWTLREQKSEQQ